MSCLGHLVYIHDPRHVAADSSEQKTLPAALNGAVPQICIRV